ncbi:response regulator transcription factor [Candidatus Woesebacteria bacterium]|nr:response regulator transcription factor [Candidatus Woesebacteria bacterium]
MNNRPIKILVADDDLSILEVIDLMLTDEGYVVETVSDGEEIYKIEKDFPDLILLDIWMSGMDGRDICKYIKSQEHLKHIPVILISANKDTAIIATESGADDFIAKPFEMEELLSKVRHFITKL